MSYVLFFWRNYILFEMFYGPFKRCTLFDMFYGPLKFKVLLNKG